MPSPPELRLLVTTFAKEEQATEVVRTLVREQLIACGTLLRGARSIYVWKDNLEDCEEIVVLLKTTAGRAADASARLKALHPYEVPEILTYTPEAADATYAQWIADSCASQ
jgi:periplasmic divalent cation tolerance protein